MSEIKDFFARPFLIKDGIWTYNTILQDSFSIYSTWKADPVIAAKLANFYAFRGSFHFRVQFNGMPFHLGAYMVKWVPPGAGFPPLLTSTDQRNCFFSQKPGSVHALQIGDNEVFDLTIPFFLNKDYLNISDPNPSEDTLGDIELISFVALLTSNSEVINANYQIYVWVEDVEVIVPTVTVASGDTSGALTTSTGSSLGAAVRNITRNNAFIKEYLPNQVVSRSASAVAAAFGYLDDIPIIGPYASIGSKFMNTVANVTAWFGLGRPLVVTDPIFVKNQPATSIAHVVGNETVTKLSFDPKQSISVDPRLQGLPPEDQMSLKYIFRNWSFLETFTWSPLDAKGTTIAEIAVNPMYNVTASSTRCYTSLAFAANPFEYWSGSIEYMIVFVVSKFHKGRVVVSYDPDGSNHATIPSNQQYNSVIDVNGPTTVIEAAGWSSEFAYKEVGGPTVLTDPISVIYQKERFNGTIRVTIANPLVGPDPTVVTKMLVFVRGGEDFELMVPKSDFNPDGDSQFAPPPAELAATFIPDVTPASGMSDATSPSIIDVHYLAGDSNLTHTNSKPMAFGGEKVVSFRSLLQRYELHHIVTHSHSGPIADLPFTIHMDNPAFPCPKTDVLTVAQALRFMCWNAPARSNPVRTPLMTWLRPAYAGYKGSIRWKIVPTQSPGVTVGDMRVVRNPTLLALDVCTTTNLGFVANVCTNLDTVSKSLWPGGHLTHYENQPILEYSVPFYSNYKFYHTEAVNYNVIGTVSTDDDSWKNAVTIEAIAVASTVQASITTTAYVAAGDDFDFILFLGSPVFYVA